MATPSTEAEAIALQLEMRHRVRLDVPLPRDPLLVAGADVAYHDEHPATTQIAAAVVVLDVEKLTTIEVSTVVGTAPFPYIPGLLGFREVPILLQALDQLAVQPDVVVCDGYGVAHPRRFGLACHLGVLTDLPTFGVAKTRYVGTFRCPEPARGSWSQLVEAGDAVGRAVRTQTGVRPVFVSPGHRIPIDEATDLTLRLSPTFRLPETTRRADRASRDALERRGSGATDGAA